jgi:hypothetical protein
MQAHNPFVEDEVKGSVFNSFGVLEHVLSYVDTDTLLSATSVSQRWKKAGRSENLWKAATQKLWEGKKGVDSNDEPIFWRPLFTKNGVSRMSESQIQAIFRHPLLCEKKALMEKCGDNKVELQRFLQVHMLDIMSDDSDRHRFFSEIYFGSFACSILDSRRETISQAELCTKHGYDMYFKINDDEVDDEDRGSLLEYDEADNILLYHHSTCFFDQSRDFRISLNQAVHSYNPTDLKWGWVEMGRRLQVGPYPPLTVSRRKDWGWKMENGHVVLFFRDK